MKATHTAATNAADPPRSAQGRRARSPREAVPTHLVPSASRPSLVEVAYHAIRRRILDNVYAPGLQVLEQTLATELGISRTPLRQALTRLQEEGLAEVIPRHGMRVLPVLPADMHEIYVVLTALESAAAELLARRRPSEAELKPLVEASRDMARALKADDLDAWAIADASFHQRLVQLTGNKRADSIFYWHTGFPGGIKGRSKGAILDGKHPERVILKAVERMVPRGPLGRRQMSNLRIYPGASHPHEAQSPQKLDVAKMNPKNTQYKTPKTEAA